MTIVYIVPIAVFVLFQITFLGTYVAAVLQDHVVMALPFISDTGALPPESCVFSLFLNVGCILLGMVIYIRYRQIEQLIHKNEEITQAIGRLSKVSVWFGMASGLGCCIVANFQVSNVKSVHVIGAFMCFGLGTVYFWIQAIISYRIRSYVGSACMAYYRFSMASLCTIFTLIVGTTIPISHKLYNGNNPQKWDRHDGGWVYHVVGSMSEWLAATTFCFYILSFSGEFKEITFNRPPISLTRFQSLTVRFNTDRLSTTDVEISSVCIE